MKRAIWTLTSMLAVWISGATARSSVLIDTGFSGLRIGDEPADVLLRDTADRQQLDHLALIRGRDKFLPPGATRYARHFDHSYLLKNPSTASSIAFFNRVHPT